MIKFSATLLATLIAASVNAATVNAATVDLRIMETTDLHSNMMDFDYYKDTATIITKTPPRKNSDWYVRQA